LLEAGGWDRDPWIKIPLGWPHLLLNRKHDWIYFAEPEASTGGRGLECVRGKVIGGRPSLDAIRLAAPELSRQEFPARKPGMGGIS